MTTVKNGRVKNVNHNHKKMCSLPLTIIDHNHIAVILFYDYL